MLKKHQFRLFVGSTMKLSLTAVPTKHLTHTCVSERSAGCYRKQCSQNTISNTSSAQINKKYFFRFESSQKKNYEACS